MSRRARCTCGPATFRYPSGEPDQDCPQHGEIESDSAFDWPGLEE